MRVLLKKSLLLGVVLGLLARTTGLSLHRDLEDAGGLGVTIWGPPDSKEMGFLCVNLTGLSPFRGLSLS